MNGSRRTWLVVLVLLALLTAACGNRLSREEILAENVVVDGGAESRGLVEGPINDGTSEGPTEDRGSGTVGDGGIEGDAGGAGVGQTPEGNTPQEPEGNTPQEGAVQEGDTGPKAPLKVGLIGWLTGTGGASLNPARDAWVAWQRSINANGGIDGHPVELFIGDDGGDAAASVSIARDFVENKGAVALTLVGNQVSAVADYAAKNSVPVIGTITSGTTWNENPFMFPAFGAADTVSWGVARLMKRADVTKVASVYCAESADCADGKDRFAKAAKAEGLEVVEQLQYSVTQPDYTAECLRLARSGAEAVYPTGDNSSLIRMVQSCERQNFLPIWVIPSADDSMAKIAALDNARAVTPAFPWFLRSGAPAVDEYAAALETYAPNRLNEGVAYQAWGWQSAKLLETAARGNLSDTPTSQDILRGLWSLKKDTLGGIAPGRLARTFAEGQPTPEPFCVFDTRIEGGEWIAPQGLTPICR